MTQVCVLFIFRYIYIYIKKRITVYFIFKLSLKKRAIRFIGSTSVLKGTAILIAQALNGLINNSGLSNRIQCICSDTTVDLKLVLVRY